MKTAKSPISLLRRDAIPSKRCLRPKGYALNETTCSFTVDENGQVSGDTVLRDDFTRFTLKKVGEHNEPLTGVAFSLKDERGAVVATVLTDADGIAHV